MRTSMHYGRGYVKHNDHELTKNDDGHINHDLTKDNFIWTCMDEDGKTYSIYEGEVEFYKNFFNKTLEKQNDKYREKGQYKRVRTMEEWMTKRQHEANEGILQIGSIEDDENVSKDDLIACVDEYLDWKQERFENNLKIISCAVHVDEPNHAKHAHIREVWYYEDEGVYKTGIKDTMRFMNVPLPDASKPESRMNYRKATIDAECREKWQQIVKEHGYNITTEPNKKRKVKHLSQDAFNEYQDVMNEAEQLKEKYGEKLEEYYNLSQKMGDYLWDLEQELKKVKDIVKQEELQRELRKKRTMYEDLVYKWRIDLSNNEDDDTFQR